jgi:hypothetical protein
VSNGKSGRFEAVTFDMARARYVPSPGLRTNGFLLAFQARLKKFTPAPRMVYVQSYGTEPPAVIQSQSGAYVLNAATGAYVVTGSAVVALADRKLNVTAGDYVLTGYSPQVLWGRVIQATPGAYSVTGADAGFIYLPTTATGTDWIVRMRRRRRM